MGEKRVFFPHSSAVPTITLYMTEGPPLDTGLRSEAPLERAVLQPLEGMAKVLALLGRKEE
jgi:hypothetical protein